jgi:uncharacterized protein
MPSTTPAQTSGAPLSDIHATTPTSAALRCARWKPSKYNLLIPLDNSSGALYNRRTGACISLSPESYALATSWLKQPQPDLFSAGQREQVIALASNLIAGEFLCDSTVDELALLKSRYTTSRRASDFLLTVIPTFHCNLACVYCAVSRKHGAMSDEIERQLGHFVDSRLRERTFTTLNVDWFGGEPLLAIGQIERLSRHFLDSSSRQGIPFNAQLVTNGTLLDSSTPAILTQCGIDRVQITIDGSKATHDKRRPWRRNVRSSFEDTVRGVESLVGRITIRLRVNIDRSNITETEWLLDFFDARGWLSKESKFFPYLAMVGDFSDSCSWSAEDACNFSEFYALHERWLDRLWSRGVPVLMQGLYGFPEPRPHTCGAVTDNAFIVSAGGLLHKCAFDAENDARRIGSLASTVSANGSDVRYWQRYDPFSHTECANCEALPSCLGGCPRNRRDGAPHLMTQGCEYYKRFEPKALLHHLRLHRQSQNALSDNASASDHP